MCNYDLENFFKNCKLFAFRSIAFFLFLRKFILGFTPQIEHKVDQI